MIGRCEEGEGVELRLDGEPYELGELGALPLGVGSSQGEGALVALARLRAETVSRASPPTKTIAVGSESTP